MRRLNRCFLCGALMALLLSAAWTVRAAPATTATQPVAKSAAPTIKPAAVAPANPAARRATRAASLPTTITGALVYVDNTSPYYAAGLRSGDLITSAGGRPIRNESDFYKVFAGTTATAEIVAKGFRLDQPLRVTVPSYLPTDVSVTAYGWDWSRYLKYYAKDPNNPDPLLRKAYADFEGQRYAMAQSEFSSATAAGNKDPLTLTKLAWLYLRTRTGDVKSNAEIAGKLLAQAEKDFDESLGDRETQAKLEGTYLIYYQVLGNFSLAGIHGQKAIDLAPHLVSNRFNYYQLLMEAKKYEEAAPVADSLVEDYPRSIHYQRLKRNANIQTNNLKGIVEASEALVAMMPDDVPARLQLLPHLDRIPDNLNILAHCDWLLRTKQKDLTNAQKALAYYYRAQVELRQRAPKRAEVSAQEAVRLRGNAEDYLLLGNILHSRSKYKDAVIAYCAAPGKPIAAGSREIYMQMRKNERLDDSIEHLWSWQVKMLPGDVKAYVVRRQKWLAEEVVLKHSFVMRNRYAVRNAIILIGVLLVVTGFILKLASD